MLDTVLQWALACLEPLSQDRAPPRFRCRDGAWPRLPRLRFCGHTKQMRKPVRFLRTEAITLFAAAVVFAAANLTGCATPAVGAPCLPEQVPSGGFDQSEAYIESSSVQCETRVCMVYHLAGAPPGTAKCQKKPVTPCAMNDKNCITPIPCAEPDEVAKFVYCTCRCESGNSKFASCSCPSGYDCTPVLEQGSVGVRGSYCVRSDTVTQAEM